MANDINSCNFSGNLVRDPELRMTAGGTPILNFSIAVNTRKLSNGEWVDQPNFPRFVMFGKRAGVIAKYFGKGSEIAVTGEGQIRTYEGKDGVKRKAYSIVASEFDFCGSKRNESSETTSEEVWTAQEEDIPF